MPLFDDVLQHHRCVSKNHNLFKMKKSQLFLLLLFMTPFFIGCSSDDDNTSNNQENVSEFRGTWTGSFNGDDMGTWEVTIDEVGTISGSFSSASVGIPVPLEGQVQENGDFLATSGSTQVGSTFTGDLTVNGEQASAEGTWSFSANGQNSMGDWSGTRTSL